MYPDHNNRMCKYSNTTIHICQLFNLISESVLSGLFQHAFASRKFTVTITVVDYGTKALPVTTVVTMGAYCKIDGDIEVRIRKKRGRGDCLVSQLWLSDGPLGLDPRVGDCVNPLVFSLCKVRFQVTTF